MKNIRLSSQLGNVLLASVFISPSIFANEIQEVSISEPEVIVTATRSEQSEISIPAAVTIIDQATISASGATNLSDVLRSHGGLQLSDRYGDGSSAAVDMRGFGEAASSNTLVLVDGRRLNNIDLSAPDLSSVSLKDIERIEIIQGSAGALYGDQAVGGVINIITRDPEAFSANLKLSAGSYNRAGVSASVSDLLTGGFSYRVSAESLSSDNYREHNELEYSNLFARVGYAYKTGKLFLEGQASEEDAQQPGALNAASVAINREQSLPDFQNDFNNTDTTMLRLGWQQNIAQHWLFAVEYADQQEDTNFILNFNGCYAFSSCVTDPDFEERGQQMFTPRFVGHFETGIGDLLITVGADVIESDYRIVSDTVNRSNDQEIESVYVQATVPISPKLNYTVAGRRAEVDNYLLDTGGIFGPGMYMDGVNINDDVTVAGFGLNYKPTDNWRLFLRWDENFRFAKLDEQVFTPVGTIGLKTQEGDSREIGIEWRHAAQHHFKLLAYRLDLEHEIGFDPTANGPWGPGTGANVNFESTDREGLIMEGRYQLNDQFGLSLSWTEIDAKFTSGVYNGNDVSAVVDRIISLSADVQFNEHWSAYVDLQEYGEQYRAGDNANSLSKKDGYTLSNLNLAYAFKAWTLNARVNNLLDEEYSEAENAYGAISPSPGRNFWLSAQVQFD